MGCTGANLLRLGGGLSMAPFGAWHPSPRAAPPNVWQVVDLPAPEGPLDQPTEELIAGIQAELDEAARAAVPPSQMFAAEHDALFGREQGQYGALDADGVPTADGAGEPLSKSAIKKLKKMLDKQKKLHEKVKA